MGHVTAHRLPRRSTTRLSISHTAQHHPPVPRHSLSPVLHTRITYPGSRMCGPAHSMCGLHPAITHAWHHCRASIRHPLVSSKAHRGLRQLHLWILLDVGFVARRPLTLLQRVCLGLTSPFLLGLYATRGCAVVKSHVPVDAHVALHLECTTAQPLAII